MLIRFTPEQLRAAIDEARYSDPRSADYMLETLVARQRKTARYYFDRMTPLDGFEVSDGNDGAAADAYSLCFDDLLIRYNLDYVSDTTTYSFEVFDYDGKRLPVHGQGLRPSERGRVCLSGLSPTASHRQYTVVVIDTHRQDRPKTGSVLVHLARSREGTMRVIGLQRR